MNTIVEDGHIMPQTKKDDSSARSTGRPRSEASQASILEAAYNMLCSSPIADISTVHIARSAGVSPATIYRWWPSKEALLLDAFLHTTDRELVLRADGSPLDRLRDYLLQTGRLFTGESGLVVARLLTAIQDNAALRRDFMARIYSPHDKEIRAVVMEAILQHQLPDAVDVGIFLDSMIGPLLVRLLIRHERIDEQFVASVFDQMVAAQRFAAPSVTQPAK